MHDMKDNLTLTNLVYEVKATLPRLSLNRLKISRTPEYPCGTRPETPEHIYQHQPATISDARHGRSGQGKAVGLPSKP